MNVVLSPHVSPRRAGPRDFFAQIERRELTFLLGFTSRNLDPSDAGTASTRINLLGKKLGRERRSRKKGEVHTRRCL